MFIQIERLALIAIGVGVCVFTVACGNTRWPSASVVGTDMRSIVRAHMDTSPHVEMPLRALGHQTDRHYRMNTFASRTVRFHRLANPDLLMWVHPHLRGTVSVPGYPATFPMYRHTHAALPGEVHH